MLAEILKPDILDNKLGNKIIEDSNLSYLYNKLHQNRIQLASYIDLWIININRHRNDMDILWNFLSVQEKNKLLNIITQTNREKFIIRKGILRVILGFYLDMNPEEIEYTYNSYGKPYVKEQLNDNDIHFNISHTREVIVIGISLYNEIGVDIELMDKPKKNIESLASGIFSSYELENYKSFTPEAKKKAIYKGWVQKEAISKAIGQGISIGFPALNVNIQFNNGEDKYHLQFTDNDGVKNIVAFYKENKDCCFSVAVKL